MKSVDDTQSVALAQRIVEKYGDGILRADKYLFDQITQSPPGTSALRIKASEFASSISDEEIIVLLDSHPSNRKFAEEVAKYFGQPYSLLFRSSGKEIAQLLRFRDCDMYLLSQDGHLLAAATHEDVEENSERMIWVPMAVTITPPSVRST